MSYRELRNFAEMMRVLGYPRLISLSNFHYPNFPLVAEILVWLVKRFDEDANVPAGHSSELERVALIRYVAEFMMKTVNIRLNTKKLYMADGQAVVELLKMTSLLYEAQQQSTSELLSAEEDAAPVNFDIAERLSELKSSRQLASQLTASGASLYELLGREPELAELRSAKLASQYDSTEVEAALLEVTEATRREIRETREQIDNVKGTEQSLDARIERRRGELERNQKRLQTLRKVRPAFMEEFEKLELELKALYEEYLHKFRYLAYLEHLYEDAAKAEQERFERRQAATKKQLEQLRIDDANIDSIMEGNEALFNTNLPNALALGAEQPDKKPQENNVQETRKSARINMSQRRLYGSMSGRQRGGPIREANGSVGSSDSDSDLLIDNIDDDDDEEEDLLDSATGPGPNEYVGKSVEEKRAASKLDHTDDEF